MEINKYTEQSGLMPREEWTKLIQINTSLLEACKSSEITVQALINNNPSKSPLSDILHILKNKLQQAINQAESG